MGHIKAYASGKAAMAALLALAHLACLGPRREYAHASDYIKGATPSRVTVNLKDGTKVELTGAEVVLDSLLTGWTNEGTEFVGYPLTDVQSVSARERSLARTAVLLAGFVTAAAIAIVVLAGSEPGPVLPGEEGEEEI